MASLSARTVVRLRTVLSLVCGVLAGVTVTPLLGLAAGILSGWGVFAVNTVVWVLLLVWPMDAEATRAHATLEAPGRRTARIISITGSLVSLGAVIVVVVQAQHAPGVDKYLLAG